MSSPIHEPEEMDKKGNLYIVATPIGNRDDITLRALHILESVDLIAAEDTRRTGRLCDYHHINNRLIAYHEHNENKLTPRLIDKLLRGLSIALVSDAGTPLVSDPGYRLIKAAIAGDIKIIPIPGVSAATAALSVAGLPTDSFIFMGFMPKKKNKRLAQLRELARESRTSVFYESPKRILAFLEEIQTIMGDRYGVLGREMTKLHEEFLRGKISEILNCLKKRPKIKGECTLIVTGNTVHEAVFSEKIRGEIKRRLEVTENSLSDIARRLANKYGLSKKKVYEEALRIRRKQGLVKK